ncbi:c-type cytochrome [Candidatus Poriferisocius sp.]|uniref:c-type cytochrome n=1 Tax=Candidatus Poriferisocius sp. TaxID=3101276 RepID=UPI003B01CB01
MAVSEAGIALRSISIALCVVVAAGCGPGTSPGVGVGPGGTPDPGLVAGRAVFIDRCSSCHDADGSGTADGPRLNQGRLVQVYSDLGDAAAVVAEGRDRMPAFGGLLTAGEIEAAIRYISEVL